MSFMNRGIQIAAICVWVCMIGLMGMASAFADSCENLDVNKAWTSGFASLTESFKAEDWDAALKHSKALEEICTLSPTLNYTIARIHKNMGNDEKYLYYLQKSTENTGRFLVDKDLLDRLWSEKYIVAHPEADPDRIKERESVIQSQSDEIAGLREQLKNAGDSTELRDELESMHSSEGALLWTSVAVTGAGLVLTAVGAVFVGMHNDKAVKADSKGYYVESIYNTGWGLAGAGVGLTVLGVAGTGYFGWRYSQNRKKSNAHELSFSVSPAYSSFTLSF